MKTGIELIAIERQEQIEKHGRTVKSDVDFNSQPTEYRNVMPLVLQTIRVLEPSLISWEVKHFNKKGTEKMESKEYKERLIIAGALIAAEIDRLQATEAPISSLPVLESPSPVLESLVNCENQSIIKPKKLIRSKIIDKLKEGEWEEISDIKELNKLYALKIREELSEIQESEHKDILEFADLIEAVVAFSMVNGFREEELKDAGLKKFNEKGCFAKLVLNNLNPENPSNKLYFQK